MRTSARKSEVAKAEFVGIINPNLIRLPIEGKAKQFYSLKKWLCNIIGIMNGLPSAQRKEFVRQMQKVKVETIRNAVDNGITFNSVRGFENVDFPVIALAGAKEKQSVLNSVKEMAEKNNNCRYEIWEKATHNIPPMLSKRFNKLITETAR